MSLKNGSVVAATVIALTLISGPTLAKNKYKMTPEEKQLYDLQLQQYHDSVAKWDAAHPAEARAQWEETQRRMAGNQCRDAAGRNTCVAPPPPTQQMCSVNYGSTTGLVPCGN